MPDDTNNAAVLPEPDEIILARIIDLLSGKVLQDAQHYKIGERELTRYSFAELQKLRAEYERRVRRIRIARGDIAPRRRGIGVVFGRGF